MKIELNAINNGFDHETCWTQARVGVLPTTPPTPILTMQKLLLTGSDIYGQLYDMRFDNNTNAWIGPSPCEKIKPINEPDGKTSVLCDGTPTFHKASGKLLLTGHVARYENGTLASPPRQRETSYAVYDESTKSWNQWRTIDMPFQDDKFYNSGSGCTQRYDETDGSILLPIYFIPLSQKNDDSLVTVMRCKFDGETLSYQEHGNEMTVSMGRGLGEPSITKFAGKYYLTLRNNFAGYVTQSSDGLNFETIKPWCFDNGELLGNYNTQQHWLRFGDDELYLTYTRRAVDNENVFRHRAPIFIARVDTEKLCVIRDTEKVVIPNRGARLGNFGICEISETESWLSVTEWMQNDNIGYGRKGSEYCASFGSDNSIFIAKITR